MQTTTQPLADRTGCFETIYADAKGDPARIPWADGRPNPSLVNWLNAVAPSLIRCGARVAVVGCGLGDDTRELIRRGYDVTAFDCSSTAVDWARRLDSANAGCYHEADLFQTPTKWRHRFDLVVEVNTIHALPPDMHFGAMSAIAEMVSPHGYLLVICRGTDQPVTANDDGPPWAMTETELLEAASLAGLACHGDPCTFTDDETPPVRRIRAVFGRA